MLAANGADNVLMLGNERVHLVKVHGVHIHFRVLLTNQLIGAVTCLAGFAVQQRVGKAGNVAGGDPSLGVHDDCCVQTHVVGGFLHELLHPCLFHIVFEFNAQRTVIPAVCQSAVNLAAGINKAAVLAEVHDHVQGFLRIFHKFPPNSADGFGGFI